MKGLTANQRRGLTLVEVIIVVMVLLILAMVIVPRVLNASDDAKESQLVTDIQTLRRQIDLYKLQHGGKGPHLNERNRNRNNQIVDRMTGRTDADGRLNPDGACGPYLKEWPANPFIADEDRARRIQVGTRARPPRRDRYGWYYNRNTCLVYANSRTGGESLDP